MKDRKISRANKKKYQEEALDRKTACGVNDPTPHAAVEAIRRGNR